LVFNKGTVKEGVDVWSEWVEDIMAAARNKLGNSKDYVAIIKRDSSEAVKTRFTQKSECFF
jgi:hypothetical protein